MKIHIKQNIAINAPITDIFNYITTFENLVDWSSIIITVRTFSLGVVQVGATMRSTIRFLGRWTEITFEVVEYELNHLLTLKSISGVAPCLLCYQFEPHVDGGTSVAQDFMISFIGGCGDLADHVVKNAVSRHLEHDLYTLKDMLEIGTFSNHCAGA